MSVERELEREHRGPGRSEMLRGAMQAGMVAAARHAPHSLPAARHGIIREILPSHICLADFSSSFIFRHTY